MKKISNINSNPIAKPINYNSSYPSNNQSYLFESNSDNKKLNNYGMKENQNPNEISYLVKAIIKDSNTINSLEEYHTKKHPIQKELNINFQVNEEKAEFICKKYLSKAADDKRKKLYTNDDGSLCDGFIRRKKKFKRTFKRTQRNFKNKPHKKNYLSVSDYKNKNLLKKHLFNDRSNGVYIVKKNIDKLLQETENELNTPQKYNRISDRTNKKIKNLKYLKLKLKYKSNSFKEYRSLQFNKGFKNKEFTTSDKKKKSNLDEIRNNHERSIDKNFLENNRNKNLESERLSKIDESKNLFSNQIKLLFNCKECSREIKIFITEEALKKLLKFCSKDWNLIEIFCKDKKLYAKFKSNRLELLKINIKNDKFLSNGPACITCKITSQIKNIYYKNFEVFYTYFSINKCPICDFTFEVKQKKKYVSKNGLLKYFKEEKIKCKKCNEDMLFIKETFKMNNFIKDKYSDNEKANFQKEANKSPQSEFSIDKSDSIKREKINESFKKTQKINYDKEKSLKDDAKIIFPINKHLGETCNLIDNSFAYISNNSKIENNSKVPSLFEGKELKLNLDIFCRKSLINDNIFTTDNLNHNNSEISKINKNCNGYNYNACQKVDKNIQTLNKINKDNRLKRKYNDF